MMKQDKMLLLKRFLRLRKKKTVTEIKKMRMREKMRTMKNQKLVP